MGEPGRTWSIAADYRMDTWTNDEVEKLRGLHLSPEKNLRSKLVTLVRHFQKNGTVFAVTDGCGPINVSKGLANKVRNLTRDCKLDWVLNREVGLPDSSSKPQANEAIHLEQFHHQALRNLTQRWLDEVHQQNPISMLSFFIDLSGPGVLRVAQELYKNSKTQGLEIINEQAEQNSSSQQLY
ncbi:hypothetical protein ACFLX5_03245 [Chloroflexota bacterium]